MSSKYFYKSILFIVFSFQFLYSPLIFASEQWRWENPLPQGNSLKGIWGSSPSEIYAVGSSGSIIYYNGSQWLQMQSNTIEHLNAVWGSATNNIYAVGETIGGSSGSVVLKYDGVDWNEINIGSDQTLYAIWGLGANDIYVAGWNGRMYHYDGTQWATLSTGSNRHVYAMWGTATDNVFAVGASGTILRYNGTNWSSMSIPFSANSFDLQGIWGSSENNIYAVGGKYENSSYHSIILHYNGIQWLEVQTVQGYKLSSITGIAANDIYAISDGATGIEPVILHYDGVAWNEMNTGLSAIPSLSSAVMLSSDNVYFVGILGEILHWDGTGFDQIQQGGKPHLQALWCGNNNTTVAVGADGTILHYDGDAWAVENSGLTSQIEDVWGAADNQVFTVARDGHILFYNGSTWSAMASGTTKHLFSIWGGSASDVFVGGDGVILHYDGLSWSSMSLPFIGSQLDYIGIWGSSENDVYAISSSGVLLHFDGVAWVEQSVSFSSSLASIHGTAANDIQVVTNSGTIMHFDGTSWGQMTTGVAWPNSISALSADHYYYSGSFGSVTKYNGTSWLALSPPTRQTLMDVCVRTDGSVIVAGSNGTILRYGLLDSLPEVAISAPLDEANISEDDGAVTFAASAIDAEDGDLTTGITWSSSIDGVFTSPAILSVGSHQITASVVDSAGQTGSHTITLNILPHLNQLPVITINTPTDASVYEAGTSIILSASASDAEDGDISHLVTWVSSLDGDITSPVTLSYGLHQLTAKVGDSDNDTSSAHVNITVNPPVGLPTADAGADQTTDEFEIVNLTGSGFDSNGFIVSYSWSQIYGPAVTLTGENTLTPSFNAPSVTKTETLEFMLTVTDNEALIASDNVIITVNNVNVPPTANAGSDQIVNEGDIVSLSGSAVDSDGSIVSYQWVQIGGPSVVLNNSSSAAATFTAPLISESTVFTFQLTATDNDNATDVDSISITVNDVTVIEYCSSKGNSVSYEWINSIAIDGNSYLSGKNSGYADHTNQIFNLNRGSGHSITLSPGFRYSSYTERWRLWVDLNANGTFESSEQLYSGASRSTINSSIIIPSEASIGTTRMRIIMRYGSYPAPCGNFSYGEVEDYTINIQ